MVLTQIDVDQIEKLVREIVKEEISHLPTKDEFYSKMDEVMKELKDIREELVVTTHRSSDNSDRIEKLEKIHPGNKHASAI